MRPRIGIVGDYDAAKDTHRATDDALRHVAAAVPIVAEWIATDDVGPRRLDGVDGILVAPGSPYRSMDGALGAIRSARESGVPLLGTCGGFQHAVIEFARNVCGVQDGTHAEYEESSGTLIVTPLECSIAGRALEVRLLPGRARDAYASDVAVEQYRCRFGLNADFLPMLTAAGMQVTGVDVDGEPRVIELPGHPFFVATLFVPQVGSTPQHPHPLMRAFVDAAARHADGTAGWQQLSRRG